MRTVLFRTKSNAGPALCADGEIESAINTRLISAVTGSGSSGESCTDPVGPPSLTEPSGLFSPDDLLSDLNLLSSSLRPVVEFALSPSVVAGWHIHPDIIPVTTVDAPKNRDSEGWKSKAAETLSRFLKEADRQHLFTHPFFALTALRLTDGHHILPSPPVLLLPVRKALTIEGSDNFALDSMTMAVNTAVARLQWRVSVTEDLSGWTDRIAALDIFISDPLPLYHTGQELLAIHRASGSTYPQTWRPAPLTDSEFTARLLNVASFRMISSVRFTELAAFSSFTDVCFNVPYLPDIEPTTAYRPDFCQHHGITAASACRFSGRVTLSDLTLTLPKPPVPASIIRHDPAEVTDDLAPVAVEIETVKNGLTLHSASFDPETHGMRISDNELPDWLFIPDKDARQISLITLEATYIFPLCPHPLLNGAIFWCGKAEGCTLAEAQNATSDTAVRKLAVTLPSPLPEAYENRDTYRMANALWRSGKDSTLYFPDRLFSIIDVRGIIALCRAFRASGLVATTSPTAYLFTTEGIYLLKEMDNGSLRDAGLIAVYRLSSPDSISIVGTTLSFTDVNGENMAISGTTVKRLASSGSVSDGTGPSCVVMIAAIDPLLPIEVITRPLKLENLIPAPDYGILPSLRDIEGHAWGIRLEGAFSGKIHMQLFASRDLLHWRKIASGHGRTLIPILPSGINPSGNVYLTRHPTSKTSTSVTGYPLYYRLKISGFLTGIIEAFTILTPAPS